MSAVTEIPAVIVPDVKGCLAAIPSPARGWAFTTMSSRRCGKRVAWRPWSAEDWYPHLRIEQLQAAIDYYQANMEEIEGIITAEHEATSEALQKQGDRWSAKR